jgi:hypothetical protein
MKSLTLLANCLILLYLGSVNVIYTIALCAVRKENDSLYSVLRRDVIVF